MLAPIDTDELRSLIVVARSGEIVARQPPLRKSTKALSGAGMWLRLG